MWKKKNLKVSNVHFEEAVDLKRLFSSVAWCFQFVHSLTVLPQLCHFSVSVLQQRGLALCLPRGGGRERHLWAVWRSVQVSAKCDWARLFHVRHGLLGLPQLQTWVCDWLLLVTPILLAADCSSAHIICTSPHRANKDSFHFQISRIKPHFLFYFIFLIL